MAKEIINEVFPALVAIGAGLFGALFVGFINHLLTKDRDRVAGARNRKRDFLAFMQQWRHEIDRWHFVTGGRQRNQMAFYDGVSAFCVAAETVRNDFSGLNKSRFAELVSTITKHGKLECGYQHDDLIKTLDALVSLAEKN